MVIDNDYQKSAKKIVSRFKKLLPVVWIHEKKVGIPHARNRALLNCRTKYLAFVDDDCLLDSKWTFQALKSISSHSEVTFVIGKTKLQNPNNIVALAQFKSYTEWFQQNINPKNNLINSQALDTKNIVLNLKKINHLRFDPRFKIFEDIDFGLQFKQKKLTGIYNPKMLIFHSEEVNFFKAIKKNYLRGQFRYQLYQKWDNFDHFYPFSFSSIPINVLRLLKPLRWKLPELISLVLNYVFDLGYLQAKYHPNPHNNLISLTNSYDQAANEERIKHIFDFLSTHKFSPLKFDSQKEFDLVTGSLRSVFIYPINFISYRFYRWLKFHFRLKVDDQLFYHKLLLRGQITRRYLIRSHTKIAIIQHPEDLFAAISPHPYKVIYDSPTIYSQEIILSQKYGSHIQNKITSLENKIFQESDIVSFHWYSFFKLAQKLNLTISHPLVLNWGCQPPHNLKFAQFSSQPKIIYIGKLNSDWINPKLLLQIQNTSPVAVDIFSYETPSLPNLKTKGFLSDLNRLNQYQFGLITISNDQLRNNGFSAKYLNYLEQGLPVLCPDWRQDKLLKPATIYYNEKNFNQKIRQYTNPGLWQRKHLAALKLSRKLTWGKNLTPLLKIIPQLLINDQKNN